jgi:hypothetical protein
MVSGLPLMTKPTKMRNRLIADAFNLMAPSAPFIQFTYAMVGSPIPKTPRCRRKSLRAHLDESAAGTRMGLSPGLKNPPAVESIKTKNL